MGAARPIGSYHQRVTGSPQTLTFEAFGLCAEVVVEDEHVFERLTTVLPPGWRRAPAGCATACFEVASAGPILLDGRQVGEVSDVRRVTLARLGQAMRHLLAASAPGWIFIHAGVVSHAGTAIVIPGSSHSGKTTLVAELVRQGASYYSDEFAVVDPAGLIHPYAKPLSIRGPRATVFGVPTELPTHQIGTEPVRAGLIVLTGYEPGASWAPVDCEPGEAALAVLEHVVPARLRPRESLRAACQLTEGSRALRGPRGEVAEAAADVLRVAESGRTAPSPR
jgi:hypothetical protein